MYAHDCIHDVFQELMKEDIKMKVFFYARFTFKSKHKGNIFMFVFLQKLNFWYKYHVSFKNDNNFFLCIDHMVSFYKGVLKYIITAKNLLIFFVHVSIWRARQTIK